MKTAVVTREIRKNGIHVLYWEMGWFWMNEDANK